MPEYTFSAMIHNPMLLAPAGAWGAAQLLKLLIYMGVPVRAEQRRVCHHLFLCLYRDV